MTSSTDRLREQTGTTTGSCTACGRTGELTVWESWTPRRGLLRHTGRRDVRRSVRCESCGYRTPTPLAESSPQSR